MKNEKLRSLMAQKTANMQTRVSSDFELLNKEQLTYAHGGAAANCPVLTSCGTYDSNNCGVKLSANVTTRPLTFA